MPSFPGKVNESVECKTCGNVTYKKRQFSGKRNLSSTTNSCDNCQGKKAKKTCSGCGEAVLKKITERAVKRGVIQFACPQCGPFEAAVSTVAVVSDDESSFFGIF
jgi:hypothetical protein